MSEIRNASERGNKSWRKWSNGQTEYGKKNQFTFCKHNKAAAVKRIVAEKRSRSTGEKSACDVDAMPHLWNFALSMGHFYGAIIEPLSLTNNK